MISEAGFEQAFETGMARKLGLLAPREGDAQFIAKTLQHMIDGNADFTVFFSSLADLASQPAPANAWQQAWQARLAQDQADPQTRLATMRAANPIFIPRNHRIEQAIAAANTGDFGPFHRLVKVLAKPFDEQPENASFAAPPEAQEEVHQTFCGT